MEVIILSGGLGTRLNGIIKNIPKVMAPINNIPFLKYILDDLYKQNIDKVILATGYKKEYIRNYFGDYYKNIKIIYSEEEKPLGTGGAIKKALKECSSENVIIMNGDIYTKVDFNKLYNYHVNNNNMVTLTLKEMYNFDRYGSVIVNDDNVITEFNEKKYVDKGFMNVGCYVFNLNVLNDFDNNSPFSIEKNFFNKYVKKIKFSPFIYDDIFVDIGLPEDYEYVKKLIKK